MNNGLQKGQGLLETIVAIGVIVTGLVSVMTLVISNLTGAREAALRYQAVNLAREGIEMVRNARDTGWLTEKAWADIVNDMNTVAALQTQNPLSSPLEQFSRTVAVTGQNNSRTVVSTVIWQSGGGERNLELTETLYDWR